MYGASLRMLGLYWQADMSLSPLRSSAQSAEDGEVTVLLSEHTRLQGICEYVCMFVHLYMGVHMCM